jgi:hypothetical protein
MANTRQIEQFWFNDLSVLYRTGRFMEFFPTREMHYISKLNSIARFSIYMFLLLFFLTDRTVWLYIPLVLIFLTLLLERMWSTGTSFPPEEEPIVAPSCRAPKPDNPFMNTLPADWDVSAQVAGQPSLDLSTPACTNSDLASDVGSADDWLDNSIDNLSGLDGDLDNEQLNNEIDDAYNSDLKRSSLDLYERESSQRSMYTTPATTIPNDQQSFAEWCYRPEETCKTDQKMCLRNEDVRFKRRIPRTDYII